MLRLVQKCGEDKLLIGSFKTKMPPHLQMGLGEKILNFLTVLSRLGTIYFQCIKHSMVVSIVYDDLIGIFYMGHSTTEVSSALCLDRFFFFYKLMI